MEIMVNKDFWKGKKVLITGHTGFKGSWLSMYLHSLGSLVAGYALDPPTNPSLYDLCGLSSVVDSRIGDINDFPSLLNRIEEYKPEIIFHLAAQPIVRESYINPVLTYKTNIIGTINVLESIRSSAVKTVRVLVNVTTDKCYENHEWFWPYRENEPLGGYDPYSSSKACSEIVTAAYRNSFFNTIEYQKHKLAIGTARAGNVIGGGDWAAHRLIPDIIKSILDGKPILIRNPEAIRPWQHVLEPLTGYLMLAEALYTKPMEASGAFNFGPEDDDTKTVKWIVEKFCNKWPFNSSYEIDSGQHPHEAANLRLDSSKAKHLLGWKPVWKIDEAIERIVEFLLVYKNNKSAVSEICYSQISQFLTGF
jgi:CDP-glucose 4,6-dehydratase